MNIFSKLFNKDEGFKKTNFQAGFLNLKINGASNVVFCTTPQNFIAPPKLDFRDMCLQTNNQGQLPHCAGYATSGFCEVQNWKSKHYPEQLDGDKCYEKAKELEGQIYDGTTLEYAAQAAIELNYIQGAPKLISRTINDVKFAVHQYSCCIGGFLITSDWNMCNIKTGIIPQSENPSVLGGHAVLICGYDQNGVYIQNSWSQEWGLYGFCFLSWQQFSQQYVYAMVIN